MQRLIVSALIIMIVILMIPITSESLDIVSDEPADADAAQDDIKVIPDEAIRLRILANSDDKADQALKRQVRDDVNAAISAWVEDITDIAEAREMIAANIPKIRTIVADTLDKEDSSQSFEVEYGKNITFPAKLYGSYLYPPGEYEAVLITLGEGEGANWWCVLFPPLCFLDFSSDASAAEADEADAPKEQEDEADDEQDDDGDEAEVRFFLFDWLFDLFD